MTITLYEKWNSAGTFYSLRPEFLGDFTELIRGRWNLELSCEEV